MTSQKTTRFVQSLQFFLFIIIYLWCCVCAWFWSHNNNSVRRCFINVLFAKALVCEQQGKDSSKGSATPYYGTVRPDPNFNASRDAAALKEAIETKGSASETKRLSNETKYVLVSVLRSVWETAFKCFPVQWWIVCVWETDG